LPALKRANSASSKFCFALRHRTANDQAAPSRVFSKAPAPVEIIKLKNRTIHLLAKLFIDYARNVIKQTPNIS